MSPPSIEREALIAGSRVIERSAADRTTSLDEWFGTIVASSPTEYVTVREPGKWTLKEWSYTAAGIDCITEARIRQWITDDFAGNENFGTISAQNFTQSNEVIVIQESGYAATRLQSQYQSETETEIASRFNALAAEWKRDTEALSSVPDIVMNRAYQQIIGLGPPVIPLILEELRKEPDFWFWALTSITGEDPAQGEETIEGATNRWLVWANDHGYSEQ